MLLCQIQFEGQACLARRTPDGLEVLSGVHSMTEAAQHPERLAQAAVRALLPEAEARFLPVVTRPGKVLCVGINYRKHIEETGDKLPAEPVLFSKFATALSAHGEPVLLPECAHRVDYEAELVIVMGRGGKNLTREQAQAAVFGYTCGNDLSARDLQFVSGQWLLGKTPDGFAPVGPFVATADDFSPEGRQVKSYVNGELRQCGNTSQMIFDCAEIVRYISRTMTLEAGDLIFTGTPDGVILGYPPEKQVWLQPGDLVEVEIEGIGRLSNRLTQ